MITQIGLVAGAIWNYLDNHGGSSGMEDITQGIQKERDIVLMSVGWLAREGYVIIEGDAPAYKLRLTRQSG
jgi:hypothetical protein